MRFSDENFFQRKERFFLDYSDENDISDVDGIRDQQLDPSAIYPQRGAKKKTRIDLSRNVHRLVYIIVKMEFSFVQKSIEN